MWGEHTIMRTIRVRNEQRPGGLGRLLVALGETDTFAGEISLVRMDHEHVVRDIVIYTQSEAHLERALRTIASTPGTTLIEVRDDVLEMHQGGKIAVRSRYPIETLRDLRRVYTPGVAGVCRVIEHDPSQARRYTAIPHLIAIVTDGTAILGLGDIGPLAGMPVMEGKAALMESLVGLSGMPILIDTKDPQEIIRTVQAIAPTFGAIQLEDISAPRCFEIEEALVETLDRPVMHDDQHGTGVVVTAALMNALKAVGRSLREVSIGQVGLGAAGLAIARILMHQTGQPVLGADLSADATGRLERAGGRAATLEEVMAACDVVVATTGVPGLIKPEWIRPGQIIFALSNPVPEIEPEAALAAGAAFAADGKVVNNVLGFPGILRGAVDSGTPRLTVEMYLAAANAIAAMTPEGALVPNPLQREVHRAVARAVAQTAVDQGLARADLTGYFENVAEEG